MDVLSWTGPLGEVLDPLFGLLLVALSAIALAGNVTVGQTNVDVGPDGSAVARGGPNVSWLSMVVPTFGLAVIAWLVAAMAISGIYSALGALGAMAALLVVAAAAIYLFALAGEGMRNMLHLPVTLGVLVCIAVYMFGGLVLPFGQLGIIGEMGVRFLPVWVTLGLVFALSITFKKKLGLYGKLFDSVVGMIGFAIVLFWISTAIFGGVFDMIVTHDPLAQLSGMKNKVPGTPVRGAEESGLYPVYLLGGDNLARDVFSRMIYGSSVVLSIAPLATLFGYIVGITLGLPAGYFTGPAMAARSIPFYAVAALGTVASLAVLVTGGGLVAFVLMAAFVAILLAALVYMPLDTTLSFIANLILAFPVILLFYLLVTPEIIETGIPNYMAAVFFIFPIIFGAVLLNSRYKVMPAVRTPILAVFLALAILIYFSTISQWGRGTLVDIWPPFLDLWDIPDGVLVVFIAVVFVNSPTIFRIVRGLTLDIKSRDYVAAAQTRGESPWYIMLWEILPNVRGPIIVDFCLRIGYATILLGTLGFFGLGLPPESPNWGSTINEGRKLLSVYLHPALTPAFSLLSLVLGLNLLADGLREESLKD